jgi:hypothetical protein
MNALEIPEFKTYDEEAEYWDTLDTASFMEDDGEWFQFETPIKRAIRVAIVPDVARELAQRARKQGLTIETLVNVLLLERLRETAFSSS